MARRSLAHMSPNRLALCTMLAVAAACVLSFLALALRPHLQTREGYQRFLLSSQAHTPDAQRRFSHELDRSLPALLLSAVAAAVSIAAGVGGGAFFVPLFNVLLQFSVKGATALSQASITGGAMSGVACLLLRRHPLDESKTLIDFDLALMLTPVLLLGVSVGVLANAIFPTWLITFLLIFLLLYITFLAARKVITLHRAEQRAATASEQLLKAQPIAPAYDDKEADTQHLLSDISVHPTESIDMDQHVLGGMQGTSFEPDSSKHAIAAKLSDKPGLQQSRSGMLSGIYANLLRYSMDSMQSSGSQLTCTGSDAWSTELSSTPRQQRSYLSQGSLSLSQLEEHQPMGSPDRDQCAASPGGDDSDLAQPPICPDDHLQHAAQDQPADHVDACPHDHRQQQPIPMPGAAQADQHQHRRGRGQVCCGGSAMQPSMADEYMQPSASAQCTQPTSGMIEHSEPLPVPPPWVRMLQLGGLWASFLILQMLKSRHHRCDAAYLLLFAVQGVLASITAVALTWQAHRAQQTSSGRGWTLPQLLRASATSLFGGIVAGLLGIGGGMVIGPLMLELGVHPLVSAATSSLMVLFSSSMGALAYAFDGTLNLRYALAFGSACCGASLVGVLVVSRAVQRSGKASIVVMLLACIVGTGALLTAGFGGRNALHDLVTGHHVGFNSFC